MKSTLTKSSERQPKAYQNKIDTQIRQFENTAALWKLPPIYSYWMRHHILLRIKAVLECTNTREFYVKNIQSIQRTPLNIVSIGSGDCGLGVKFQGICFLAIAALSSCLL